MYVNRPLTERLLPGETTPRPPVRLVSDQRSRQDVRQQTARRAQSIDAQRRIVCVVVDALRADHVTPELTPDVTARWSALSDRHCTDRSGRCRSRHDQGVGSLVARISAIRAVTALREQSQRLREKAVFDGEYKLLASRGDDVEITLTHPGDVAVDVPHDRLASMRDALPPWPGGADEATDVSGVVEDRLAQLGFK